MVIPVAMLAGALVAAPPAATPAAKAATAYTLEPLNYNLVETTPSLFGGAVCLVYECERVPTSASLDLSHRRGVFGEKGAISQGAARLDDRLTADADTKLVFGFSQGAQVAGFWLRNYAPTTAVDPATTSFLLVGDPENTYGVPWAPRVPTDTGFEVTEVWKQYDGWADWPDRFDLLAVANAVYGMLFVHPTVYDDLDLDAERAAGNVVTWTAGGITYEMVVDKDLPILDPLRNLGLGWVADLVNDDWREHVEAQYDRPSTQEEADELFAAPLPAGTEAETAAVEEDESETEGRPARGSGSVRATSLTDETDTDDVTTETDDDAPTADDDTDTDDDADDDDDTDTDTDTDTDDGDDQPASNDAGDAGQA
ncbi:hypothetical protein BCA37_15385 [Mycobacterium sp. djl-10]|nr:hypothetical protein BCA37_15385 [Mycobacterium sp. djl-10]